MRCYGMPMFCTITWHARSLVENPPGITSRGGCYGVWPFKWLLNILQQLNFFNLLHTNNNNEMVDLELHMKTRSTKVCFQKHAGIPRYPNGKQET